MDTIPETYQYTFRLTTRGGEDLTNVEYLYNDEWIPVPRFFFVANMLRNASDVVLEGIDEDISRAADEIMAREASTI